MKFYVQRLKTGELHKRKPRPDAFDYEKSSDESSSLDTRQREDQRVLDIVNDVHELALCKLIEKGDEISLAAVRLHVVLLKERVVNLGYRSRCLNKLLDAGTNGIMPVVDAIFEIEDCRFIPKIC